MQRFINGVQIEKVLEAFPPQQHPEEFLWLWDQLPQLKTVLEIGVCYGGTSALWMAAGANVIGIDPEPFPEKDFVFNTVQYKRLVPRAGKFTLVRASSLDPDVIERFQNSEFDLIHIDGDHSVEACYSDWHNYGHLAPIVAVHDIYGWNEDVHHKEWGPRKLWDELHRDANYHPTECCVRDSGGIGLVERYKKLAIDNQQN